MIDIKGLPRKFKVDTTDHKITVADPNPASTADQVMELLSLNYPELTNASVSGPEIVNDEAVYTFKTTLGTKG